MPRPTTAIDVDIPAARQLKQFFLISIPADFLVVGDMDRTTVPIGFGKGGKP
jgi:hypothetical protein